MKHHHILRRGLCILLSLAMCLTMMPVTALANESDRVIISDTTQKDHAIIATDETMSEKEESVSAGDTTPEKEESVSAGDATSEETPSTVICGMTLEEGKAYIANAAEIGGIAERTEETDYFEYAQGVLTVHGNITIAQPADATDHTLKLEDGDLTINCPSGSSLTVNGQNASASIDLQTYVLTLTGAGDVTIKGKQIALNGGTMKSENYSGNLAISAESAMTTVNGTVLNLDTTGNISITGYKPIAGGSFTVTNASDVTITGSAGNVLPEGSIITATGNVTIESTNNMVVAGLTVNNAQNVTLKGNTTDSVAMNVTFNNCTSWDIINENKESTAPLTVNFTVDGTTYDSYYGEELAEDETTTESDTVSADGASSVKIDATNFPDEVFRTYIKLYIDKDEDGVLSEDEIKNTTVLTIGKRFIISGISGNVADLTGLQYFTELTYLDCEGLQLTKLDISKNTKLTSLACDDNKLTTLDISKHTLLTYLNCENNQLTALNLSQHTSLERLYCGGNQFTTLDLSNNSKLTLLNCTNSLLKTLDVSNHSQLITLDIRDNTKLTTLNCSNCKLTGLDISGDTALEELNCANNNLAELDLSSNTKLTTLDCRGNVLTVLNLSNQKELTTLNCESNFLTSLDLSETKVAEPSTNDNTYAILLDEKRAFSLSELPEGFDVTKASNWEGGTLNSAQEILTINEGVDTVTYNYNCGNEVTVTFTLTVNDGSAGVIINATNFPDANFRESLKLIDKDGDNILNKAEIESKVELYVSSRDIKSLEGIEYFTNMETLECDLNELTTLDLSKNTKLKHLNCYNNQLTTLDLSSCPALETLDCTFNNLTTLNLTNCTALKSLDCYSNELTTIDLSTNTALETLKLGHNELIKLNISKNTALKSLDCAGNQLTALDVSKNTALESLDFAANNVTTLDVSKNKALTSLDCGTNSLTKLDISKNTALQSLLCNGNQLKKLDVSKNTSLTFLNCIATYLTTLDVSKNTELSTLYCEGNSLTVLDLSQNSKLTSLRCGNNNLTSLDLSNISGLKYLSCDNNYFKIIPDENRSFDLSTLPGNFDFSKTSNWQGGTVDEKTMILTLNEGSEIVTYDYDNGNGSTFKFTLREGGIDINATNFPDNTFRVRAAVNSDKDKNNILTASELKAVETLEIQGAGIESLKGIEYFTSLKFLDCSKNELTTLDLSNNTALEELYCTGNQLTTLDVSNCTALKKFYCYKNELTKLDVSDCTALQILNCRDNKLTKLDVGKNAELSYLDCKNNKLSTINVTNCPKLQSFYCIGNRLTKLDVSKNTSLVTIECSENKLTKLDFSNNGKLQFIDCKDNKLTTLKLGTCSVLRGLLCSGNKLKTLDVSGCENLLALDCSNNNLTGLNVEPQIKLTELDCSNNKLTELNLINNGDLSYLDCSNNNLTFLKVSSCINELNCSNNKLTKLDFTDYGPTNLDCSNNVLSELKLDRAETQSLDCSNNKLQKLDLRLNDIDYLDCSNNDIFILNLDIYNSSDFTSVDCSNNKLNSLDFRYSNELSTLKCNNNGLTSLNISKCAALTSMDCSYNVLTSLDLSKCTKLTSLSCDNNNLTSLDLSKCVALETFSATGNIYTILTDENRNYELSSLPGTFDVTKASNFNGGTLNNEQTVLTVNDKPGTVTYNYDCGNSYSVKFTLKEMPDVALNSNNFPNRTFLAYVKIFDKDGNNKLSPAELMEATQIDVSGRNIDNFKGIEYFFALESLNISGNTSIKELNLSKNYKLTDFDASGCTKLSSLTLQHHITGLNISNTNLNNFYFFLYQDLEVLDISGLQMPKILDMSNNRKLISFKASGCGIEEIYYLYYSSNLKILDVSNNHLVSLSLSRLYSLKSFNAEGNTRNIGTIYNGEYGIVEQLDLSESLILEVKGATLDRESGKLTNIEGTTVTYVYDTQNKYVPEAKSVEFTLIFDRNMTVNYEVCTKKGSDGVYCETWEEVLAAMNDKTKDYYVYLHNDVEVDKLTFPSSAKAKSVTLLPKTEGEVKTITMKAASVSLPIDVSLENICIEATAEKGFSISANKNLSLNEFRSASLTFIKGGSKSALVYTGSEDKTITTDYRIEGFGNVELSGSIAFNNMVKANNLVLNDASTVYTGAYSVNFKTITAKTGTAIRYNTADFTPITVEGTVTADEPITIGVSKSVSGLKLSENQTVITGKNAELSLFVLDEDDIETGYTLGKEGNSIKVMKGAFSLSYNAGGTNNYIVFATWSDILNEIAYNAKLNKQTAKTIEYKILVVNDANIGGALKMPKAGTFKSLEIKGGPGLRLKTLTFTGTTVSVTGTTTIENLVLNSVKKNTDQSVDFSFSAGKNELFLDSVSGKIKDVKASGVVTLCDVTVNGNVSAKELFVTGTLVNPTISKTSVTINKNLNVKGTLSIKGRGSLTVKGGFFAGGLVSTVSEDKISLVLCQNVKKPAVIGKGGFANSEPIRFALVDSEGNAVSLTDNMVIASINCVYTNTLIPCSENLNGTDFYIIKEKNKLVAKAKKDSDGKAVNFFEVKLNDKTAYYLSPDSAIQDINTIGKKTDEIEFLITKETFPEAVAKLPLPKAGKYQTLTYKTADGSPTTIQIKGDIVLSGDLIIDSSVTIDKILEIKLVNMTTVIPMSINVGKYEFHAGKLSYDTTKSVSMVKNISGKGSCDVFEDMIVSGKITVKTLDITRTVTLSDDASLSSSIRTVGDNATLKYSLSTVKNVKLGNITNIIENRYPKLYVKIPGLQSGDKIATLTDDYFYVHIIVDDGTEWVAVRSDNNALVVVECDKRIEVNELNSGKVRVYDSYESVVADITRLKDAKAEYRLHVYQDKYEWNNILLPAKGKYGTIIISSSTTTVIEVKSDIKLTGNFAIGQNTTLRKVNADGSVADVLNFISPKDKQGKPVYTVTTENGGKIVNGRLNGESI